MRFSSTGGSFTKRAKLLCPLTPTDTALALTQTSSAVANSPTLYYESLKTYGRTFARVVPSGKLEAKALVAEHFMLERDVALAVEKARTRHVSCEVQLAPAPGLAQLPAAVDELVAAAYQLPDEGGRATDAGWMT